MAKVVAGFRGKKKVVIAMSGGLDSSVAAALLKKGGFYPEPGRRIDGSTSLTINPERSRRIDVVGVFMKFWSEPLRGSTRISADSNTNLRGYENRCCSSEAEARARKVAKILKIPFYVFNFEKEFKKRIVNYFLKGCKEGITPNPCVVCNKEIKFGLLLEKALALDADFVATGHYARLRREILNSKVPAGNRRVVGGVESEIRNYRYKLLKAKDKNKDQSYFLWMLNQEQLKRILFPIGDYTRKEVENSARKFKLPVLKARKSVEICFIQTTINDFLKKHLKPKPGRIVEMETGKVLGQHKGLVFYTLGQRKGIGLAGGPYFVLAKDMKKNFLLVSKDEKKLFQKEVFLKDINWLSGRRAVLPLKVKAKIRYRQVRAAAEVRFTVGKKYQLVFAKPQRAITPGQSAVFYRGEELLGGGIIKSKIKTVA
ncbi:MAG: tRNA 2-thiouridine(34) synthase MnmA [Candidatus Nealsonbacteria bacterium CG08_land_8_20_14_0_20_43_11]|uniref:tRNA-specific 2-thiouridylase MnmA n=1 Tax=Candidatus Nealsonbacteria bacterium CG08_land_8_20_14_0_20_43_11 TaxID=1974706 RepID=A0A2M6T082_9BACT|nr:MAG: tRNA 2-thiouridine(34) synthase MnmA [Candidatus Nealsonbacteria bacterium CG08_land_8_20_14_0_20_43_11]